MEMGGRKSMRRRSRSMRERWICLSPRPTASRRLVVQEKRIVQRTRTESESADLADNEGFRRSESRRSLWISSASTAQYPERSPSAWGRRAPTAPSAMPSAGGQTFFAWSPAALQALGTGIGDIRALIIKRHQSPISSIRVSGARRAAVGVA